MLVLSRKLNERVMIGDLVEVSVLCISRDKVKLGFSAPKKISVHRKEIYELIHRENVAASRVDHTRLEELLGMLNTPKVADGDADNLVCPEDHRRIVSG